MADDVLDELFALPPGEFTDARNALMKRLRAEGRKDDAAALKALRRPTVPAWALNQTVRRDPAAVERLIEAGAAVGAAQRRALSGVRDSGLREASAARRERIDEAWRIAAQALTEQGVAPAAHRQAVADTLEAASVEPEAAQALRAGQLTRELPAPSGFGAVSGFALVPTDEPAEPTAAEAAAPSAQDDEAAAHAAQARLDDARRDAEQSRRRADDLTERAGDARQAAVRAVAEAERLEKRARQARDRAENAADEADQAAAAAAAAEDAAEDAAAALDALQD